MTEQEAQTWLKAKFDVSRETWERLARYVHLLVRESQAQNLIAASTIDTIWSRHIVDSAQLAVAVRDEGIVTGPEGWWDLGSGAGLPGIVLAVLTDWPVYLVEERRMRIGFLENVAAELDLKNAQVVGGKVQRAMATAPARVISARAFAPLPRLLDQAAHLGSSDTFWVLPKGRNWQNELANAQQLWHGMFHVKQSVTDADSALLIIRNLKRKGKRR